MRGLRATRSSLIPPCQNWRGGGTGDIDTDSPLGVMLQKKAGKTRNAARAAREC